MRMPVGSVSKSCICIGATGLLGCSSVAVLAENVTLRADDPLLGPRVEMKSQWFGRVKVPS